MEYVLLDMYWNKVFNSKEFEFIVRQLAAIRINKEMHTVSTFHRLDARDSKTAKQITYIMDASEDIIMDFESAWEEFKQWLPENVVFIVWDSELRHIIQKYNKIFRKKPIRAHFVDLQMLQEAMMPIRANKKSLGSVMAVMGLTCEQFRMRSVLYCVQCMLRLYRKLWKEGRKSLEPHEWENLLRSGDFTGLQKMDFFSEIISKSVQAECCSMIKNFCMEKRFELHIKGTRYEIDADSAVWQFDLTNCGKDLVYIPKKYVQLPHYDMQIKSQEQNMVEVLPEIFDRIICREERLKFGVGSAEVEGVVKRLGAAFFE